MGGVDLAALGVAGEGGDVEAVLGGDVLENALVFRLIEEGEFFVFVVEIDEDLLDGSEFFAVVAAEAGAEDDGVFLAKGKFLGVLAEGVGDDVEAGIEKDVGDGFHGVAINHKKGGVAGGEVMEESGELAGGPEGVIEEGKFFAEECGELGKRGRFGVEAE